MPHIHEKIDFTAEVFIVCGNTVLLRKHDKYKMWLSVGGHVELDEDPNRAAVREVKEEVGLDVRLYDSRKFVLQTDEYEELIPPAFMNRHRISDTHEHVTMTFFGVSNSKELHVDTDVEVSDELKWFTWAELESLEESIKPQVKRYAMAALEYCGRD